MIKNIPLKYRIWKEGKYLDFWNIPHITIGFLFAFVFIYFRLTLLSAFILTFLIKTIWEIYEHYYVLKETISNKILDVLTGMFGVLVLYVYNDSYGINLTLFVSILIIHILLSIWGLYSAKKLNLLIK